MRNQDDRRSKLPRLLALALSGSALTFAAPAVAVSGYVEPGYSGVARLSTGDGLSCTATLVGPRHLVTMGTCVDGSTITVSFTGEDAVTSIHDAEASSIGEVNLEDFTVHVLEIADVPPLPIAPLRTTEDEWSAFGSQDELGYVTGFGFEYTNGQGTGTKRTSEISVGDTFNENFQAPDLCGGDEGGPVMFLDQATGDTPVVGIVALGSEIDEGVLGPCYGFAVRWDVMRDQVEQIIGGSEGTGGAGTGGDGVGGGDGSTSSTASSASSSATASTVAAAVSSSVAASSTSSGGDGGEGGRASDDGSASGDGCGCHVTGRDRPLGIVALLGLTAVGALRRRRSLRR